MNSIKLKPLIILDFGSQYTQLIARRVREMGVFCEIYPFNTKKLDFDVSGFILSGGPSTVVSNTTPKIKEWVFEANKPILGICYGMQALAHQLGGKVQQSSIREFGNATISLINNCYLFQDIGEVTPLSDNKVLKVWMSHGDKVIELPRGFTPICKTTNAPIAGMADESKNWYGVQFHPEVTHTNQGEQILQRFVLDICKAPKTWNTTNIIEEKISLIQSKVGDDKVLLALSGGVDSSVVAALLSRAIGKQLICVFVDSGLLRFNEVEQVMQMFKEHLNSQIILVDAKDRFLHALRGVECPETKRKIIGRIFIEVFEEQAKKLNDVKWLAQGTIYPDVIESSAGSLSSEVIKSHHNVAGIPDSLSLKLLEPVRELFKDEVRKLGIELGLPEKMIMRHPFPGPGLAVRILGEVKPHYIDLLKKADAIFIEELQQEGFYQKVSQAFAVFLPVKSVAVLGDSRHYDYVIALRAVETQDFMTAIWAKLPWDFLGKVSNRIVNEVKGISRVVYDITGKPPATIEWE